MFDWLFPKKEEKQEKKKPMAQISSFTNKMFLDYKISDDVLYSFYRTNPYICAVINKISSDIWANGIEIQKRTGDEFLAVEDDLLEDLIKDYDQNITIKQFLQTIVRDIEILANAYIYFIKDENDHIVGIRRLDPRYIIKVSTDTWETIGYIQNLKGQRAFLADEIYHIRDNVGISDETKWESKMISLFVDLETDKEAKESNLAFFRNNQTPSSLVVLNDDYTMSDTATLLNEIKELFSWWQYQGGKNHYRSAVVQGVKEIVKIQDKIEDSQFLDQRKFTMQLVCAVYDVPQDMIGITDTSNKSVGDIQSEKYYNTIASKERRYSRILTDIVEKVYDADYRVVILEDNIRVLKPRSEIARWLYNDGIIDLNEARDLIQYDKTDNNHYKDDKSQANDNLDNNNK